MFPNTVCSALNETMGTLRARRHAQPAGRFEHSRNCRWQLFCLFHTRG